MQTENRHVLTSSVRFCKKLEAEQTVVSMRSRGNKKQAEIFVLTSSVRFCKKESFVSR
jgi:hypothetical protein